LDVGATEYVRGVFLKKRCEGSSVLLVSEEIDELLSLCDRIIVMYGGRIVGEMEAENADIEKIGLMMAGVR
jgi:simple sugar transport system ATP-binding protein